MKKCYSLAVYEPDGSNAHFETKMNLKREGAMAKLTSYCKNEKQKSVASADV